MWSTHGGSEVLRVEGGDMKGGGSDGVKVCGVVVRGGVPGAGLPRSLMTHTAPLENDAKKVCDLAKNRKPSLVSCVRPVSYGRADNVLGISHGPRPDRSCSLKLTTDHMRQQWSSKRSVLVTYMTEETQ